MLRKMLLKSRQKILCDSKGCCSGSWAAHLFSLWQSLHLLVWAGGPMTEAGPIIGIHLSGPSDCSLCGGGGACRAGANQNLLPGKF